MRMNKEIRHTCHTFETNILLSFSIILVFETSHDIMTILSSTAFPKEI